jgi:hypothetical protein
VRAHLRFGGCGGRSRRGGLAFPLRLALAVALVAAAAVLPGATAAKPLCAGAAGAHRAAVVVEHGDGSTLTRCVGFDAAAISGYDLLAASGIQFATVDYGGSLGQAVCQIDREPASYPQSCFGSGGSFWAQFASRGGGAWQVTSRGVSNTTFGDGDAEGFRYDGQGGSLPPPRTAAAGVCPAATPPPPTQTAPPLTAAPPSTDAAAASAPPALPSSPQPAEATPASTPAPTAAPESPGAGAGAGAVAAASSLAGAAAAAASPPVALGAIDAPRQPASTSASVAWVPVGALAAGMVAILGWQLHRRRR